MDELSGGPEAPDQSQNIARLFDTVRSRLVETGTRNRLVHVNRANTRGNVLNIVNEHSNQVFSILAAGKAMRFLALGKDKFEAGDDDVHLAPEQVSEDRRADNILETKLGPDSLQKKLLKLHREAQTAEEESGVNLLYLALGFLTWYEDPSSEVRREAPLVLVPVELARNAKTSTFDIRMREDEFPTNLPLQQRLKTDFGIELPDLESVEGWKPSDYFDEVADAVASQSRWSIEADAIQLGFFSFSKLLMYRDLDPRAWPDGALAGHELVKGLLYEGFDSDPPLFADDVKLDEVLQPEDIFHIVDADASQATVIEEVKRGRNLVVQGPPGTGKSQTITNIIAAAVKDGKRVLFVAEKMAALSVVHDRLVKAGLRDVCLELHSRSANKKAVLAELAHTLNNGRAVPNLPSSPEQLKAVRDRLNTLSSELHRRLGESEETGFSLLSQQCRFIGMDARPPSLDGAPLTSINRQQLRSLLDATRSYAELASGGGRNAFEGTRNLAIQPVDLARLQGMLETASSAAKKLHEHAIRISSRLEVNIEPALASAGTLAEVLANLEGLPEGSKSLSQCLMACPDLDRLCTDLEAALRWRDSRSEGQVTFVDYAFEAPVAQLRAPLIQGTTSFFARWGAPYRRSSKELAGLLRDKLPNRADERVGLVDQLLDVSGKRREWDEDRDYLGKYLGDAWRGDQTDFASALVVARWLKRLASAPLAIQPAPAIDLALDAVALGSLQQELATLSSEAGATIEAVIKALDYHPEEAGVRPIEWLALALLAERFAAMAANMASYVEWARLSALRTQIERAGIGSIIARIDGRELDAASAAIEVEFARAEALWKTSLDQTSALRSLGTENRHELAERFAALERERFRDSVSAILAEHLAQLPQGAMGEMKVIRGEIGKKRAHVALRRLFKSAGQAIQRIKPVLLMSPISVAQFLPPGTLEFDMLLIDEASQVRPEDALGAIARAKQIVVVGDKKQLPPSSFFDRLMREEDEDATNDEGEELLSGAAQLGTMESVLTLCEARGLGSRMLSWHYRSRDPSLIKVSNREFYGDGLILPPSPTQHDPTYGLRFTHVDGVYDRGGRRDNRREGEAVVARVAEHAKSHPDLSLGIVTFSFAQRNLITELLELARRNDSTLDRFLRDGKTEDVFVKNIENVQGDERDVILVTVGYGPSVPGGKLASMSFGPVNSEGGERRLNVLFTRARVRCEIFASFEPGDIDLGRAHGEGPRVLKRFLEFAKSGDLNERLLTGEESETPFEQDVADVVRGLGFLADPQVGSAGFRVDMGIRHPAKPGYYILAIECDGATYHSALWARERDRLRQEVLENLGWRFHRIWSTDWFYRRAQEIERLRLALEAAQNSVVKPAKGVNEREPERSSNTQLEHVELFEAAARTMPAYCRCVPARRYGEPHEASLGTLGYIAQEVISVEGPIHVEEVARRIAATFGKEKAGSRIISATRRALYQLQRRDSSYRNDGDFWFTPEQATRPPVRDRSCELGATLKAASISTLEIRAAIALAREDNAGGGDEEIVRSAARLLGFRRVGSDLKARLSEALT